MLLCAGCCGSWTQALLQAALAPSSQLIGSGGRRRQRHRRLWHLEAARRSRRRSGHGGWHSGHSDRQGCRHLEAGGGGGGHCCLGGVHGGCHGIQGGCDCTSETWGRGGEGGAGKGSEGKLFWAGSTSVLFEASPRRTQGTACLQLQPLGTPAAPDRGTHCGCGARGPAPGLPSAAQTGAPPRRRAQRWRLHTNGVRQGAAEVARMSCRAPGKCPTITASPRPQVWVLR